MLRFVAFTTAAITAGGVSSPSKVQLPATSPPFRGQITVEKWERMQQRRVQVDLIYSKHSENLLYAEEASRVLKRMFPDVILVKMETPADSQPLFRIIVDSVVVAYRRPEASGVALKMSTLASVIQHARAQRRPGTVYAPEPAADEVIDEDVRAIPADDGSSSDAREALSKESGAAPDLQT